MPGLLKRPYGRIDSDDTDANAGAPERKRQMVNGDVAVQTNGVSRVENCFSNNAPEPDAALAKALDATASSPPPEIYHVTAGYVPLHTLIDRVAQETFNQLDQLINELVELQSHQVNGYGSSQSSQIVVQKKERLFDFAHGCRKKFISLLVLSQWSRQSEAVSKVIDIHSWNNQQRDLYRNATAWMGELKRMLSASKLPAPDLKTTLEVLSTGKAEWLPHLGYIPTEPYTPQQLLKALRTINTLLTIRLNVHETIPPEMMDFSIASGRATFRVKNEFELDVSIAEEDPTSQLYFIDFRFMFMPCAKEVPAGPMRDHIEGKANDVLRRQGLTGCYEFLHELVLTQKLMTLRYQAFDLIRNRWSEHIKIEPIHRSVVVQYWINRPGPKNWIEIGVKKRRRKRPGSPKEEPSSISLRWHRHGKEVLEHGIEVDAAHLSFENVLKEIIASHTNYIFKSTKRKLKEGLVYKEELSVKHRAHPTEPAECSLKAQITRSIVAEISQEPISGFFAIAPASAKHFEVGRELNRLTNPANDAAAEVTRLRCTDTMDRVRSRAKMRRWEIVRTLKPTKEIIEKLFGKDCLRYELYRISAWDKTWILALTSGRSGDSWWVVELRDAPQNPVAMDFATEAYSPMRRSLRLKVKTGSTAIFDSSYSALSLVEKTAAAVISQFVDAREMTKLKIKYEQRRPLKALPDITAPDLFINFPHDTKPNAKPWCHNVIKSTYLGLSRSQPLTTTVVTARLRRRIPDVKNLASTMESALAFHPENGDFAFRLRTPLGIPSVVELNKRFSRIESLVKFVTITSKHNIRCTRISLDTLTFAYPSRPSSLTETPLTASIHFPSDGPTRLSLAPGNPHLRIADFLNTALNSPVGLEHLLVLLEKTLPLLRGFDAIEGHQRPGISVDILPRSATCYQLAYTGRGAAFAVEIRMRQRAEDGVVWYCGMNQGTGSVARKRVNEGGGGDLAKGKGVKATGKPKPTNADEKGAARQEPVAEDPAEDAAAKKNGVTAAWLGLAGEKGARWYGLGWALLAQTDGGEDCVKRIDEVIAQAVEGAGGAGEEKAGAEKVEGGKSVGAQRMAGQKGTAPPLAGPVAGNKTTPKSTQSTPSKPSKPLPAAGPWQAQRPGMQTGQGMQAKKKAGGKDYITLD